MTTSLGTMTATSPPPPASVAGERARGRTRLRKIARHAALITVGFAMIYPLLWLVASSLKPNALIFQDLSLWPAEWDFSNYTRGWTALSEPFHVYIWNSFVVTSLTIVGNVVSCSLAAYAFARLRFRGRGVMFAIALGTLMLPGHVLLVPQYVLFANLGWLNTYLPLLVPNFLATTTFFIFLIVQFMRNLPKELDEAAVIDGAGPYRTFGQVILPLCIPALATVAIFTFVSAWNEFFAPLIYLTDSSLYTVPLALRQFMDSEGQSQWGPMFAMSVISLAPVVAFFIIGQRFFIKGIATTGIK